MMDLQRKVMIGQSGLGCAPGGTALMERVRFFARQLLTPDDLIQEQEYMRAKMRRHNRFLHGWGVVCGCEVKPTAQDWTVTVTPGYVLAPQGDEIMIENDLTVDLSQQDLDGNAVACGEMSDPWCATVRIDRKAGDVVYIAVAYSECMARPVRVQPAGCGCDGSDCEYSRVRDGYVVRVLTQLPSSYANMTFPGENPFDCPQQGVRECPTCPSDPWVILAAVQLQAKTITDADIDNDSLRRYVGAFGNWWFRCGQSQPEPGPAPSPTPAPTPLPTPSPLPTIRPTIRPTLPPSFTVAPTIPPIVRATLPPLTRAPGIGNSVINNPATRATRAPTGVPPQAEEVAATPKPRRRRRTAKK